MVIAVCLQGPLSAQAADGLRQGDTGAEVSSVQTKLRERGFSYVRADGYFNSATERAVREFQRQYNLPVDGVVNTATYEKLMGVPRNPVRPAVVAGSKAATKPPLKSDTVRPGSSKPKPLTPAVLSTKVTGKARNVLLAAYQQQGVPYRFGGTSSQGFDCSGLVWYAYGQQGIKVPRTADVQYKTGKFVPQPALQPGDIVFFSTYEPGPSHCGIYSGDGQFIHASSSRGVMVSRLDEDYWRVRYLGAKRWL